LPDKIVFFNNLEVITCSYLIYFLILLDLRDSLLNVCSGQLSVPPAARGERTCEEVDTVCCQVGLWEDEGELAESAHLISLYIASQRSLRVSLEGSPAADVCTISLQLNLHALKI